MRTYRPIRFLMWAFVFALLIGFMPGRAWAQAEENATPVQVYVVQSGDTLREIAEAYGTTWEAVAAINRLANPNVLNVGQSLQLFGEVPADYELDTSLVDYTNGTNLGVPGAGPGAGWNEIPVLPSTYQATDQIYYVQSGDTLGQIAARYGVPLSALIAVNNITNAGMIHVGQAIVIAGPAIPPAPAAPIAEGKVILVSIAEQYLWAYENGEVVVESFVTTGRPRGQTRPGTFEVLVKYTDYRFISPYPEGHELYYNSQVSNYSLRYTWDGFHIHDAPWRSDYGPGTNLPHVDSLGRTQTGSIGCVNVTGAAMARLFEWAEVGTKVVVVE